MADKKHKADQDDKKTVDTSILRNQNNEQDTGKTGLTEVDKQLSHRSGESIVEGGKNEKLGEPTPGYSTVAPGHQNGGQR